MGKRMFIERDLAHSKPRQDGRERYDWYRRTLNSNIRKVPRCCASWRTPARDCEPLMLFLLASQVLDCNANTDYRKYISGNSDNKSSKGTQKPCEMTLIFLE